MMHRVEQRFANDCWKACVASLLELPYQEVAAAKAGDDEGWYSFWKRWFADRGFAWWERPIDGGRYVGFGELTIVSGASPRTDGDHCVLAQNGEIVWDPHPQREMGIGPITSVTMLVPLDPARMSQRGLEPA